MLRIFIAFPLIGIALPDAAFLYDDFGYKIPQFHLVVFAVLIIILTGSYFIKAGKKTLV